ncbi:MAG: alkaline phosphatase family protein [Chloroflexota bacterium]
MISPAKRAVIIGMDGASMKLIKNMAENGTMPNVAKLLEKGVHREMWGVLPTLTPPGWTTISTGAWPGTHGVMDFNIRDLGQPLDHTRWGVNSTLCQAEYLWNAAERGGRVPILVKWEMSWPPTVKTGVQVEGTGPGVSNYHQIAGYHLFTVGDRTSQRASNDAQEVDPSALSGDDRFDPISLRPAEGWQNLPASAVPCLEAELTVRPLARSSNNTPRGKKGEPKQLFALVYGNQGYERVRVTRSRDGGDAVADLAPGEWSGWARDTFVIDGKPLQGSLRFKLLCVSPSGDEMELFMPQIWPVEGYTFPDAVASELLEHVGPFLQNPARDAMGVVDDDTYFEALEYHHEWLANAALYLASSRPWDLLFLETHASDYANHFFLGEADPISGASAETLQRSYSGEVRTYASIDRMIGKLMTLLDDETAILLVSDHGGTPNRFPHVNVNDVLEQAGLLVYTEDAQGRRVVDWGRTRATSVGIVNIFINLKGREPNGIVDPADYESVRSEIIAALQDYREPTSGWRPFNLAVRREDAEMVNLWGELVGDVVYTLLPEFDGAHGRQLPSARLGMGAHHATFVLAGPGVRQGVHLTGQVRQVDVAPTLAHLLGLPVPRNAEGGVVYEALEDPDWYLHRVQELEQEKAGEAAAAPIPAEAPKTG